MIYTLSIDRMDRVRTRNGKLKAHVVPSLLATDFAAIVEGVDRALRLNPDRSTVG